MKNNGWDPEFPAKLRAHKQLRNVFSADQAFHRKDLLDPASLIPDSWMEETCATGSIDNCVQVLEQFKQAGADELILYGTTPAQNAGLIDRWRTRGAPDARTGASR